MWKTFQEEEVKSKSILNLGYHFGTFIFLNGEKIQFKWSEVSSNSGVLLRMHDCLFVFLLSGIWMGSFSLVFLYSSRPHELSVNVVLQTHQMTVLWCSVSVGCVSVSRALTHIFCHSLCSQSWKEKLQEYMLGGPFSFPFDSALITLAVPATVNCVPGSTCDSLDWFISHVTVFLLSQNGQIEVSGVCTASFSSFLKVQTDGFKQESRKREPS